MQTSRRTPLKTDSGFGLDSRNSWITAAFSSAVLFLTLSTIRVSGVIFYGIVETFGVSRQRASWPLTLSNSLVQLAGPVMGFLCRRYSCRKVLLTCSSVTGVSVSLCYFAKSVYFLDIFLGVIHGVTLCGLFVGVNILVAQHFEKRRTTACSLIFTVGGLNIVLASLVEWFRATYGTLGSFLLYGGILMNAFPFAIALRSPPWLTKSVNADRKLSDNVDKPTADEDCTFLNPTKEVTEFGSLEEDEVEMQLSAVKNTKKKTKLHVVATGQSEDDSANLSYPRMIDQRKTGVYEVVRHFLALTFWLDALSFSAVVLGMGVFVLVSNDLSNDRGLSPSQGVYLVYAFSATDIVFRPLAGLAIDSNIMSLESVMLCGFLLQGIAFEVLALFRSTHVMLLASVLMGTTCGSRMALQTPALVKDFGIQKLPIMIGGLSFCVGLLSLLRPALVGLFRDTLGSYNGLLHAMAVFNASLSAVWLLKIFYVQQKQKALNAVT